MDFSTCVPARVVTPSTCADGRPTTKVVRTGRIVGAHQDRDELSRPGFSRLEKSVPLKIVVPLRSGKGQVFVMNLSQFFISRPVFAGVLSTLILIAGLHLDAESCRSRNIRRSCRRPWSCAPTYPGANPTVIADTVAGPLEQSITGIEDMLYQFSQATERRRDDAHHHLQARHRCRQGAATRAEPRRAGDAETAAGRAASSALRRATSPSPDITMACVPDSRPTVVTI